MSEIASRVKAIIVDKLGVEEQKLLTKQASLTIWEQILLTL